MKNIFTYFIVASVALLVGFFVSLFYDIQPKLTTEQSSTVLLEKIKTVSKLVTVEGYFSEVWQTTKTKVYFGFPSESKAIIKVKGKVSVGYNLEQMRIESFPEEKVIRISNLPNPEIISVDHDLEYFSLEDGYFVSFTTKEMSDFNKAAKDTLIAAAGRSRLFDAALEKGNDIITLIELIANDAGWSVEYDSVPVIPEDTPSKNKDLQGSFLFQSRTFLVCLIKKINNDDTKYHTERHQSLAG